MVQKEQTSPVNSPTPAQQEAKKAFSRFSLYIVLPFLAANIMAQSHNKTDFIPKLEV